jgi:membrane protein DedA with SNARE-associated domain
MIESFILSWGYLAVFLLTVAESACIPIPSELTLGVGGALASGAALGAHHHHLNLALVIAVGSVGSVVGSFVAYAVGRTGGRAFVDRFGKYLLLTHKDLDRAEAWFTRRGDSAVLVGRVVPVVRTFISLPAGLAEMPLVPFGVFTAIGVTVWVGVLSGIGYALGGSYHSMVRGFGDASYAVAGLAVVAIAAAVAHRVRVIRAEQSSRAGGAAGRSGLSTPPGEDPAGEGGQSAVPSQSADRA